MVFLRNSTPERSVVVIEHGLFFKDPFQLLLLYLWECFACMYVLHGCLVHTEARLLDDN